VSVEGWLDGWMDGCTWVEEEKRNEQNIKLEKISNLEKYKIKKNIKFRKISNLDKKCQIWSKISNLTMF
jgi:hypothetical protein